MSKGQTLAFAGIMLGCVLLSLILYQRVLEHERRLVELEQFPTAKATPKVSKKNGASA